MQYENMVKGTFIERENRFVARVLLQNPAREVRAHVKNTGRCRELLVPGAQVWLQDHSDSMGSRKLSYSLINVLKKGARAGSAEKSPAGLDRALLINMDSQAPNQVVFEALEQSRLHLPGISGPALLLQREKTFGNSRLDLYLETAPDSDHKEPVKSFIEVKGVTLEENGVARFPDAPTERGIKHLHELTEMTSKGYLAYLIFVIQMKGVTRFEPNEKTHPAFGDALRQAAEAGVHVLAYDCAVTENRLSLDEPVPVFLTPGESSAGT